MRRRPPIFPPPAWSQSEFFESWKGVIAGYTGAVAEFSLKNADGTTVRIGAAGGP